MTETSRNDITGDELKSKSNSDKFRDGWDKIYGNSKKKDEQDKDPGNKPDTQINAGVVQR